MFNVEKPSDCSQSFFPFLFAVMFGDIVDMVLSFSLQHFVWFWPRGGWRIQFRSRRGIYYLVFYFALGRLIRADRFLLANFFLYVVSISIFDCKGH
jgi:hypothetical protein